MATTSLIDQMDDPLSFGEWLKCRRKELDLTQTELATRASCTVFALRKIEGEERRPSKQLAGLLAQALEISTEDQAAFVKAARGELSMERLPSPARTLSSGAQPVIKNNPVLGNLPRALTPFIGREPELNALDQLLRDPECSLLTMIGPGGMGKTRLAIEAAKRSKDLFPDGIWLVPLAALASPVHLVQAIADAIDYRFQDSAKPQAQLLHYLSCKRALLILDNAEQLLDGVGIFTEILKNCPQVKLLVTSRERLNLLSEWVFEILGLPVPPDDQVDQFESYSAVALFLQSARRIQAGFELRAEERQWVLHICQTLEGMPLGIELSAAWVGMLPSEEIAKEIKSNLDFLTVSMHDLPERHRSLRATLDYSWKLLNPEEKLILSRLSVFRGNFRREDAKEICGASLAVLSSLKNKTLLYRTDQDYYGLHELIRQYAGLKLTEDPAEEKQVKDRHALYYVQRLSEWEVALKSPRQVETFHEMALEIDNLSQGWKRMVASCEPSALTNGLFRPDLFHSSLFSLSLFYEARCRSWEAIVIFSESAEQLRSVKRAIETTGESSCMDPFLGHVMTYLGLHHVYIVQLEKARAYLEESIELLENGNLRVESAQARVMLAWIHYKQGRLGQSESFLQQCRATFREAGEDWWYQLSGINLAVTYLAMGNLDKSEEIYQEGFRSVNPGDLRLGVSLRIGFALTCYFRHDFARAEQLMQDNLQLSYQYGNDRHTAGISIDLAQVAIATGRIELAEKYLLDAFHLVSGFGESPELAMTQLYLGKCLVARRELEAARVQFRQLIKFGQTLNAFYLVYWGLVNVARAYLSEGQTEKALEIGLALSQSSVEYKKARDEGIQLQADLQAVLPNGEVGAARKQAESRTSLDTAEAEALAYVAMRKPG